MPTMTNEAKIVAAKSELVDRERGCSIGGIVEGRGRKQLVYDVTLRGGMRKRTVFSALSSIVSKRNADG